MSDYLKRRLGLLWDAGLGCACVVMIAGIRPELIQRWVVGLVGGYALYHAVEGAKFWLRQIAGEER